MGNDDQAEQSASPTASPSDATRERLQALAARIRRDVPAALTWVSCVDGWSVAYVLVAIRLNAGTEREVSLHQRLATEAEWQRLRAYLASVRRVTEASREQRPDMYH